MTQNRPERRMRAPGGRSPLERAMIRRIGPVLGKLVSTQQQHRRLQFGVLGTPPGRTVFLGDSITEGGVWDEWFPDLPVLNRGVAGETSTDVLARLDTAIVAPTAVLLLIGTNDLTIDVPQARITANIDAILRGIEQRSPGTPVWVQSVMPRTARLRPELQALNGRIRGLVSAAPDHVRHLDLWPALATSDGRLRDEYSIDHLHLNGAGYRAWVEVLRTAVPPLAR